MTAKPTITDDQIRELRASTLGGRQNAHTRSLRKDCDAALAGSTCCREHCAEIYADPERRKKCMPKNKARP